MVVIHGTSSNWEWMDVMAFRQFGILNFPLEESIGLDIILPKSLHSKFKCAVLVFLFTSHTICCLSFLNWFCSCGDGSLGVPDQKGDNYECRNMKLLLKQQQRVIAFWFLHFFILWLLSLHTDECFWTLKIFS